MMSLPRFLFLVLISTLFESESLAQGNFSTRIVQLPGVQMKDFQVHNKKVYSMNYPARVMVHSDSG
ncbi:MAG TPA: hypothetical protein PLK63_17250, partial [Catalimonadaceae bacterium]|nr:hypothetical protein [Catalimonadaceae bacterium]